MHLVSLRLLCLYVQFNRIIAIITEQKKIIFIWHGVGSDCVQFQTQCIRQIINAIILPFIFVFVFFSARIFIFTSSVCDGVRCMCQSLMMRDKLPLKSTTTSTCFHAPHTHFYFIFRNEKQNFYLSHLDRMGLIELVITAYTIADAHSFGCVFSLLLIAM